MYKCWEPWDLQMNGMSQNEKKPTKSLNSFWRQTLSYGWTGVSFLPSSPSSSAACAFGTEILASALAYKRLFSALMALFDVCGAKETRSLLTWLEAHPGVDAPCPPNAPAEGLWLWAGGGTKCTCDAWCKALDLTGDRRVSNLKDTVAASDFPSGLLRFSGPSPDARMLAAFIHGLVWQCVPSESTEASESEAAEPLSDEQRWYSEKARWRREGGRGGGGCREDGLVSWQGIVRVNEDAEKWKQNALSHKLNKQLINLEPWDSCTVAWTINGAALKTPKIRANAEKHMKIPSHTQSHKTDYFCLNP